MSIEADAGFDVALDRATRLYLRMTGQPSPEIDSECYRRARNVTLSVIITYTRQRNKDERSREVVHLNRIAKAVMR